MSIERDLLLLARVGEQSTISNQGVFKRALETTVEAGLVSSSRSNYIEFTNEGIEVLRKVDLSQLVKTKDIYEERIWIITLFYGGEENYYGSRGFEHKSLNYGISHIFTECSVDTNKSKQPSDDIVSSFTDSFSESDENTVLRAEIACSCGKISKLKIIVPYEGFGDLMKALSGKLEKWQNTLPLTKIDTYYGFTKKQINKFL